MGIDPRNFYKVHAGTLDRFSIGDSPNSSMKIVQLKELNTAQWELISDVPLNLNLVKISVKNDVAF